MGAKMRNRRHLVQGAAAAGFAVIALLATACASTQVFTATAAASPSVGSSPAIRSTTAASTSKPSIMDGGVAGEPIGVPTTIRTAQSAGLENPKGREQQDVRGVLTEIGSQRSPIGSNCVAEGASNQDVGQGSPIRFVTVDGLVLAAGSLSAGVVGNTGCEFTFEIRDINTTYPRYYLELPGHGILQFAQDELIDQGTPAEIHVVLHQ